MSGASSPGAWSPRVYWLISSRGSAHEAFLLVDCHERGLGGGLKALPVFRAERAAEAFLESGAPDGVRWRVRRVDGGELISLLYGPCQGVSGVVLDPAAAPSSPGRTLCADLGRVEFLDVLSGRTGTPEGAGTARVEPAPGSRPRTLAQSRGRKGRGSPVPG